MNAAALLDRGDIEVLRRIARQVVGASEADDFVGDVLLDLCVSNVRLPTRGVAIKCVNQAVRWRRCRYIERRKVRPESVDDMAEYVQHRAMRVPAPQLVTVELGEVLRTFARLPQHLRDAVTAWVDNPNMEAIARARGVTQGTMRGRLSDARRVLANPQMLADLDPAASTHRRPRGSTTKAAIRALAEKRAERVREYDRQGKTNAQIAQLLGVNERHVRTYRSRYRAIDAAAVLVAGRAARIDLGEISLGE